MRLNLIYAQARNGVIGLNNALPWHLPEDMAHFKRHTQGCPVLMGRRTWESLPPRFRPLPGRLNAVLTRDAQWGLNEKDILCFTSIESALDNLRNHPDIWVIGGAQIYALALPLAQRVEVTEIDADFEGDAFAPTLPSDWVETRREHHVAANGMGYSFITYLRSTLKEI